MNSLEGSPALISITTNAHPLSGRPSNKLSRRSDKDATSQSTYFALLACSCPRYQFDVLEISMESSSARWGWKEFLITPAPLTFVPIILPGTGFSTSTTDISSLSPSAPTQSAIFTRSAVSAPRMHAPPPSPCHTFFASSRVAILSISKTAQLSGSASLPLLVLLGYTKSSGLQKMSSLRNTDSTPQRRLKYHSRPSSRPLRYRLPLTLPPPLPSPHTTALNHFEAVFGGTRQVGHADVPTVPPSSPVPALDRRLIYLTRVFLLPFALWLETVFVSRPPMEQLGHRHSEMRTSGRMTKVVKVTVRDVGSAGWDYDQTRMQEKDRGGHDRLRSASGGVIHSRILLPRTDAHTLMSLPPLRLPSSCVCPRLQVHLGGVRDGPRLQRLTLWMPRVPPFAEESERLTDPQARGTRSGVSLREERKNEREKARFQEEEKLESVMHSCPLPGEERKIGEGQRGLLEGFRLDTTMSTTLRPRRELQSPPLAAPPRVVDVVRRSHTSLTPKRRDAWPVPSKIHLRLRYLEIAMGRLEAVYGCRCGWGCRGLWAGKKKDWGS
ncbi:hypothetical protein R3P38DRAFT_2787734 [Favolaschia claudopus]|uniref:Uncharacterized protein n=1 Tax=Favolaschia claudopus TaxID=2862362 RepID=A0AAW0ANG5_9AGAR